MKKETATPLPSTRTIHEALAMAGFSFNRSDKNNDGVVMHGYTHMDGRAAIYTEPDLWALMVNGEQHVGTAKTLKDLVTALKIKQEPLKPVIPALPPPHVVRAIEILGGLTKKTYILDALKGEKNYKHRVTLLKKLFQVDKVLVKESTLPHLVEAFYSALGIVNNRADAAKAIDFAQRCKAIAAQAAREARMTKQELEAKKRQYLLVTEKERAVPGPAPLPAYKRPSKKQDRAAQDALAAELAVLVASPTQPALPHSDAPVTVVGADVRLLEDPGNGIVMMQIEKANSQGAICVYNNGSRVACGVVSNETLKTLRPIEKADIIKAANQLLNPIIPGVPVTHVAVRHLTAVLRCKELIPVMATKTSEATKTKKFAPPAGAVKKALKDEKPVAAKPKQAKSAATKEGHAPWPEGGKFAGQAITVVTKEPVGREGTWTNTMMKYITSSKTTDEAVSKLAKDKEYGDRKLDFNWAVKKGFIKLK